LRRSGADSSLVALPTPTLKDDFMSRLVSLALACAAAVPTAAAQPAGQPASTAASHDGTFVVRVGKDTVAVERFSRTGSAYAVEQALQGRPGMFHTHVELTPAGDVASLHYMQHRAGAPADAPLISSRQLTVKGDSATLVEKVGDSTAATRRYAVRRGTMPTLTGAYLPMELAAMRLVSTRRDVVLTPVLGPDGPNMLQVRRLGPDSMSFVVGAEYVVHGRVDAQGRILALRGVRGAQGPNLSIERVPDADVNALAARWSQPRPATPPAAAPAASATTAAAAQQPARQPASPADSVKAKVGQANVVVRYSRPSKRGRVVFGDSGVALEPWGRVWRTGANEATRLTTDRDLVIGGATVPAGTYTLWTLLDRRGWKLIVNKQLLRPDGSGRPLWGTQYDPTQDLVRVDMRMSKPATPVELMTIAIERQGQGSVLAVSWDTTRATVPIRAK
jgi:hypothetical protein